MSNFDNGEINVNRLDNIWYKKKVADLSNVFKLSMCL